MDFPQYRKRFDNKSFYKIINERTLEEVQLVGGKKFVYHLKADKYFELLKIQEIVNLEGDMYQLSNEEEFNTVND